MRKSIFVVVVLIYKMVIEWAYIYSISPLYSYSGLTFYPNFNSCLISYFFVLIILLLFKLKDRPSSYLYLFLLIFMYVPLSSYYWMNSQSVTYYLWIFVSMLIVLAIINLPKISIPLIKNVPSDIIRILFVYFFVTSIFLIFRRGGIDSRALNFDTVYELREENNTGGGFWGYILNWNVKAFAPLFISLYLYQKKYYKFLFVVLIQLLFYLSFGNKAFLFSIFVVSATSILFKYSKFMLKFPALFSMTVVSSVLLFKVTGIDALQRALPYRMLYIPSQIQYQYFTFFSEREKLHFSENFLGKILGIEHKYGIAIPILISRIFSGRIDNNAFSNTGIFSDAYSNGGYIIMILTAFILGGVLILIDSVSNYVPNRIVVPALSYILFVINDTPLSTTFITGGLGIIILLIYLLNCYFSKTAGGIYSENYSR